MSGRLVLAIKTADFGVTRVWRDRKNGRQVETHLNSFVGNLYLTADAIKQKRVDDERRRLEALEAERRCQEMRRLQYEHDQRVKLLDSQVERWERVDRLRTYLQAAQRGFAAESFSDEETADIETWLDWIGRYADSIDPSEIARRASAQRCEGRRFMALENLTSAAPSRLAAVRHQS